MPDPTVILTLPHFTSFLSCISGFTGDIMVVFGGEGGKLEIFLAIRYPIVEIFCDFIWKKTEANKKMPQLLEGFTCPSEN